ncbi:MAG: hypothetical protein BJ554DRAFT_7969 [Olpidium bornovanus]|uniref:AP180 N-terminal homology (ANTH) domain-containing protein n=1 Tax=Olpidium bornovanus TaxID=278681 RepID=A0A8H7ZVI7_9FUNG|nr:MAG: hypothetical protein BJ554DRAFT_7969 [Olpidium bornovanus]
MRSEGKARAVPDSVDLGERRRHRAPFQVFERPPSRFQLGGGWLALHGYLCTGSTGPFCTGKTSTSPPHRTQPRRPRSPAAPRVQFAEPAWSLQPTEQTKPTPLPPPETKLKIQTVFKALIVIHTLARDGCAERVLNYLAGATHILNLAGFRSRSTLGAEQTKNIHAYAAYLEEKVAVFRELRIDFAGKTDVVARLRGGQEKDEWRLNEIRVLQRAIDAVLGCKVRRLVYNGGFRAAPCVTSGYEHSADAEHYFEMNKADARKSLNVYKKFCTQTEKVVEFLDVARRLQTALGTAIPRIKHVRLTFLKAPISLAVTLEDYLNSSDFEENREEYKARKARKALNRSGHDMSQCECNRSVQLANFSN